MPRAAAASAFFAASFSALVGGRGASARGDGAGLVGFAAPAWGLWRWRGGWRIAAAVPAAVMAVVVLRIAAGTAIDPTSHNLWPFEVLQAGALSLLVMLALWIARKAMGAGR